MHIANATAYETTTNCRKNGALVQTNTDRDGNRELAMFRCDYTIIIGSC